MKTIRLVCLIAGNCFALFSLPAAGEPASSEPQTAAPGSAPGEIERLRHEFDRQRANALRPVLGQYIAQLETLQKSVVEKNRAAEAEVAEALKAAKEEFVQVDQPELRRAILGGGWIWRSDDDRNGVTTVFHADGAVEHFAMRGAWQITGPNEITITTDGDGQYVLHFGASLRGFEGDRHGISGDALPSAAEILCANIWSLRGDKLEFRPDGRLIQRGEGWVGKDWRLSEDGTEVMITFTNGNGGAFKFENGTMRHFDGALFEKTPRE